MNRKSLIGAFALAATLSAPLAFAQSQTGAPTDASAQSSTATDASAQTPTTAPATTSNDAAAATAGESSKKSWKDVDLDKSGSLSKAEAAAIPALGQVFDQADSNADGALSAEEYKAFVGKAKGAKK